MVGAADHIGCCCRRLFWHQHFGARRRAQLESFQQSQHLCTHNRNNMDAQDSQDIQESENPVRTGSPSSRQPQRRQGGRAPKKPTQTEILMENVRNLTEVVRTLVESQRETHTRVTRTHPEVAESTPTPPDRRRSYERGEPSARAGRALPEHEARIEAPARRQSHGREEPSARAARVNSGHGARDEGPAPGRERSRSVTTRAFIPGHRSP